MPFEPLQPLTVRPKQATALMVELAPMESNIKTDFDDSGAGFGIRMITVDANDDGGESTGADNRLRAWPWRQ
jgi:hypothetical protein